MSDRLFRRKRKRDGKPFGSWIAWGYDAQHKRWQESTHQRDHRAAQAIQRELERRYADPAHARKAAATLNDAFVLLVDDRKSQAEADPPKCSMDTVKMYEQKAGTWIRVLRELYPEKDPFLLAHLEPAAVDDFLKRRRKEKIKEHTLHKELTTLRAALRLAKRAGIWKGDIEELIPPGFSPGYKPRKRFLSPGELPLLFGELPTHGAAIVAFVIATSARRSEVFRAKKKGVAPDLATAHLPGKKTDLADRVVPIEHPMAKELLRFALDNAGTDEDDELLFLPWPSPNHAIRRACVRAKIPHTSFNDLRRTFATWLRQAGVPSNLVAPAMGHKDTKMVDGVYGELPVADVARQTRAALALAEAQEAARLEAEKREAELRAREAALAAEVERVRGELARTQCSTGAADGADGVDVRGQAGRFSNEKRPVFQGVVVGHDRLELSANGLRVRCSTN